MQMYFQTLSFEIVFRFDEVLIRPNYFHRKKKGVRQIWSSGYFCCPYFWDMKKITLILILISITSCIGKHRVDVWKTMTIAPGDSIVLQKLKAPATLEIKNLSHETINLVSELNMPKTIIANSQLNYRLPKRSRLIMENPNSDSVSIHLHYSSSKPILINNQELR